MVWIGVLCLPWTAHADVFDLLPADAPAAAVGAPLNRLAGTLQELNRAMGWNDPRFADPITYLKSATGLHRGIDWQRRAAIVYAAIDPPNHTAGFTTWVQGLKPWVLLPIENADAFWSNFNVAPGTQAAGISWAGAKLFARIVGRHVLIGESREAVLAYRPPRRNDLQGVEDNDVTVVVRPARFKRHWTTWLKASESSGAYETARRVAATWLPQTDRIVLGMRRDQGAWAFRAQARFMANSDGAKPFADPARHAPSLSRLTGAPLIAAAWDPAALPLCRWLQDDSKAATDADVLFQVDRLPLCRPSERVGMAWYPLNSRVQASRLEPVAVYETPDPKRWMSGFRDALSRLKLDPKQSSWRIEWFDSRLPTLKRNAGRYRLQSSAGETTSRDYGRVLIPARQAVLMTAIATPAFLMQAIEAADGKGSLETHPSIVEARRRLPMRRAAEMFWWPAPGRGQPMALSVSTGGGALELFASLPDAWVDAMRRRWAPKRAARP